MHTNKILVVGGAGYIGSHMVKILQRSGLTPIVVDNLSTGYSDAVRDAELMVGDIADPVFLAQVFTQHTFKGVMHFASFIQVGESVLDPQKYYANNVAATLQLLNVMLKHQVNYFIFSSSAAVYGWPETLLIDESHSLKPINPYGHSKRMVEQILDDYAKAYGLRYAALRYFNAAGADPDGELRERHVPETHLIPLIVEAAHDSEKAITVFGRDYDTPDGTCVRDYVHVNDLCDAHLLALEKIWQSDERCIYNLGTGQGHSVQQVIDTVQQVLNKKVRVLDGARRAGDPAVLVADAGKAQKELLWRPKFLELRDIVQTVL